MKYSVNLCKRKKIKIFLIVYNGNIFYVYLYVLIFVVYKIVMIIFI